MKGLKAAKHVTKAAGAFTLVSRTLTCLKERDLVVLAQSTETWDVLCELHHILHGVSQPNGTVLPHLVH